jgi:hypothetical protein
MRSKLTITVLLLRKYVLVGANGEPPPPTEARVGAGARLGAVRTHEVLEPIESNRKQALCHVARCGRATGGARPKPSPPTTPAWGKAAQSDALSRRMGEAWGRRSHVAPCKI